MFEWVRNLVTETKITSAVAQTTVFSSESTRLQQPQYHWRSAADADIALSFKLDTLMVSSPVTLRTVSGASVYLTGGRHAVTTPNGESVSQHRVSEKTLTELPWQHHKKLSGRSLLLGNSAGANCYYHWMMDLLPKLGYLEQAGISLNSIDHFLVREITHDFQQETLTKLGIDESRIIQCVKHPYYTCDELLILNLDHRISFGMNKFVPNWIRKTFLPMHTDLPMRSELLNTDERIKLYITRPDGVRRGIDNEQALIALLKDKGFAVRAMEGLSVHEQGALLARTDVLIAAHGGALTNMVFAKPGTKIIELFGSHVYPYYSGLANLCNHEYHALLQQPEQCANLVQQRTAIKNGTAENQLISQNANFSVDLKALEHCLAETKPLAA